MSTHRIAYPEILWIDNYWDGPLSGMCVVDGERCLFEMTDEAGNDARNRTYNVYRLSPERLALEEYWHAQFVQHVGTYWTRDPSVPQVPGGYHPKSEHAKFYEPFKAVVKDELSAEQAVAWFDDAGET